MFYLSILLLKICAKYYGMTEKRAPRKKKELDITKDIGDSIKKNFDCSNIKLKRQFQLTDNQTSFYYACQDPKTNMVIVDGVAGSSKTYLAVYSALELLKDRHVDKIIYIRTVVESSTRSIGALPGELEDKFSPYSIPLIDKLNEIVDVYTWKSLMDNEYIKAIPVNFVRGSTFHNSAVILDECFEDTVFVETDKGKVQLKSILKEPDKYKVLSVNMTNNQLEYKNVVNTFEKGEKLVSKMTLNNRSVMYSTKNHRYLTPKGWVPMEELKIGDAIVSSSESKYTRKQLNNDQLSVVLANVLAGSVLEQVDMNTYKLACEQNKENFKYVEFKSKLLGANLVFNNKVSFVSEPLYLPYNKDTLTKEIIDNLDVKTLAILWQECGHFNQKNGIGILYGALNEELTHYLAQKLETMGYKGLPEHIVTEYDYEYHQIRFRIDEFEKLCRDIAPYIHKSMDYKVLHTFKNAVGSYNWYESPQLLPVRVVEELEFDIRTNKVYDIEVEDNHNFVVSSSKTDNSTKLVVHNCQNMNRTEITTVLTRFGRNSKYFILGDSKQSDIKDSGFTKVYELFDTEFSRKNNIHCMKFDTGDIVRSPILKHITQVLGV